MDFHVLVAVITVNSNNRLWLVKEVCLPQENESILYWFLKEFFHELINTLTNDLIFLMVSVDKCTWGGLLTE